MVIDENKQRHGDGIFKVHLYYYICLIIIFLLLRYNIGDIHCDAFTCKYYRCANDENNKSYNVLIMTTI